MKIFIASNNNNKTLELKQILALKNIEIITPLQLPIPNIIETGLTFIENALLKAKHACHYAKIPTIADDSGLEIDALAGKPGIYSARYAEPKATDAANIAKVLQELQDIPESQRTARFQCIIVFLQSSNDPNPIICQGTWEGKITLKPEGANGFGYDPIFWVPEYNCTAAQLSAELKNKTSHRARALQQLKKYL